MAGTMSALLAQSSVFGSETTLYRWPGSPSNPGHSNASLIADAAGNLYGTATGASQNPAGGSVFELSPPTRSNPNWTEKVLWLFSGGADGGYPLGTLVFGRDGALYGTTEYGGNRVGPDNGNPFTYGEGVVFRLLPPKSPGNAWTEQVLHSFNRRDTAFPVAGLALGAHGEFYGTTLGNSDNRHFALPAVYAIFPPSTKHGPWREVTLYRFGLGIVTSGAVIVDTNGNLFGATVNGGTTQSGSVYELSPSPAPPWKETDLYDFAGCCGTGGFYPVGPFYRGSGGILYGTTYDGGVSEATYHGSVFELVPPPMPGGRWQERDIHYFDVYDGDTPYSGVIGDASGALYGTTYFGGVRTNKSLDGYGVVYKLTLGRDGKWHDSVLHKFRFADGILPNGLIEDAAGALYGTTGYGTRFGAGTAFKIAQ